MARSTTDGSFSSAAGVPPGIVALGPQAVRRLDRLVSDAHRRQDEAIDVAVATTLHTVPRPLRGVIRKAMGA